MSAEHRDERASGIAVGLGLLAFVAWFYYEGATPSATTAAPPVNLWHVRAHGGPLFGCRSKAELQRIVRYSAQGDQDASMRLFGVDMLNGECRSFNPGEPVFVADSEVFEGLVRVRRQGRLGHWWTFEETIAPGAPPAGREAP